MQCSKLQVEGGKNGHGKGLGGNEKGKHEEDKEDKAEVDMERVSRHSRRRQWWLE